MAPNYSCTKIYMIYCNDDNISDIYIGYSTDIKGRMSVHRRCSNNSANKSYNMRMYNIIRNNRNNSIKNKINNKSVKLYFIRI
jgi:predicted GIY-YIG superfamily endonuclease